MGAFLWSESSDKINMIGTVNYWTLIFVGSVFACASALEPCPGDTRGDKRCNWDSTHRVCAKIGLPGTSFWHFTRQNSWCNTRGYYGGQYGRDLRCPADEPTWCICKWATARWIAGEGCNDNVQFDCNATDVCNLKASFHDFNVNLKPAHDCMIKKCPLQWQECPSAVGNGRQHSSWHSRHFQA